MMFLVFSFILYAYGYICDDGYTVVNDNCVYNPQCNSTTSYGYCNMCTGKYTLVGNNLCVYNPQCTSVDGSGHCNKCVDKYSIVGYKCECVSNLQCTSVDDYGRCIKC